MVPDGTGVDARIVGQIWVQINRLNRFSLRGKTNVQGQWQLYSMVHNIEKPKNYGKMAA